ncbi:rta1 domain-containingprotein [Purpureocillium lavendulum]|uniref:Rta1 domain-containingprotein n=1 Tax=Purpureocillium lavendulum TaxID=1247861 RepID=A0AB34FTX7_9HYPO|nr:rta1 domain-containingprotein [Purpureocillium lavendulum]
MSPDGPFGPVVNGTQIVFYEYRPSKPAAITFVALFGLVTLGHFAYLAVLRAWFTIPLVLGGIGEAFGYYGRCRSSDAPASAGPFILQNLLILASAPFIAATMYMTLGRIIVAMNARRHALVSPRWLTKLFILIDVGCVATQVVGSVLPASGERSAIELSKKILLGGLITQVAALALFALTCWHAHRRIARGPPLADPSIRWQNHFRALELATLLLVVRSVVRAVEYLQGEGGFVVSHEAFIYACDALPMFAIMAVLAVLHPAKLIRDARGLAGDCEGHGMLDRTGK